MTRANARAIEAEAAAWVTRIDREGRSALLDAEIEAWIGDDPRRRGALLQAEAAWTLLGAGLAASDPVSQASGEPLQIEEPWWRVSWLPRLAVGSGLAAILALTLSFGLGYPDISPETRYETALGEVRRVPLGDGSIAAINSSATVVVEMEEGRRVARLREGEAWFQVAKDVRRPFVVEAGRVRVQAVGTAFAVRRFANGAGVLVSEGVVEAWVEGAEGARVRLTAGERAFVANDAGVHAQPASAAAVDRALAWRAGRIDLAGETLDHAIDELNRYNARKLRLESPELGSERLHGVFRTDDPEGFASAVAESLDMRVRTDGETIVLTAR